MRFDDVLRRLRPAAVGAVLALSLAPAAGEAHDGDRGREVRVATYNVSLNRATEGELVADLSTPENQQARNVAEVIQRARPDVLLLNEFDFDAQGRAAELFQRNYLSVSQNGARPIRFRDRFVAPSNTGVPTGKDLNNDGRTGTPDDAFGFGLFPGHFGMVVFSRLPIDHKRVRTFQTFRWKDMPGARLPDDASTPAPQDFYAPDELDLLRLSSKSHWDLPLKLRGERLHLLASHPTPPVFDGPEDRNGKRNADEIRFWSDYVTPGSGAYVYDDQGRRGGLGAREPFAIAGDQNSDPLDGDSLPGAVQQLLENPRINASAPPTSEGAVEAGRVQGGANAAQRSDPRFDTADFADGAPGNLRADYVLPDRGTAIRGGFVFWPLLADPLSRLTGVFTPPSSGDGNGFPTSDHRLVAVDLEVGRRER